MQFEKRIRKEMLLSLHQGEFRHQTSFLVWYKRKKPTLVKDDLHIIVPRLVLQNLSQHFC